MPTFIKRFDFRVSVTYGVIATLWIIFSDTLAYALFGNNPALNDIINTFKGLGFVAVTATALYTVLSAEMRKRTRIEEELQRERDISPIAILIFDSNGLISYINNHAEKLLGKPRSEIIGQPYNAPSWHVTDHNGNPIDADYPNISKMIETHQTIYGIQQAIEVVNGKRILLDINLAPIFDNANTITGAVATFRDVTSAKLQEKQLQDSEHSLKHALAIAHLGDWSWDIKTNTVQASDEIYHIFGLDRATFRDHLTDIIDAIHPDDAPMLTQIINQFLNGDPINSLEFRIIQPNQSVRHVWAETGEVVRDKEGAILKLSGTLQDITAHKLAEQALQESEARYRMLVEQASDGIFISDQENRYVEVNSAGCTLLGYSRDEILQLKMEDVLRFTPDTPPRLKELQAGNTVISERELIRKDGSYVAVEISGTQLSDGRFQGITRDITQRKRTEKALQESEARYRMLIEQASDAILIVENNGPYLDANSAACKMLGYTRDEILQKTMLDLFIIPQDKPLRYKELHQGKTLLNEREMIRKDGSLVSVEVSTKMLLDGTVQAIARDITERKQAEEELRLKSAALEAAANGIAITDINGIIQWVNPAFAELTGYSTDEAEGHNPRELVRSGLHDQEFYETMWHTILRGEVWRGEIINRQKDGVLYNEEMTITPVRNEAGKIRHFIAIKQDITNRKRQEEAIQKLNEELEARVIERTTQLNHIKNRIESILNSNADAVVYCRVDSQIEQVNPAFTQAFGYETDEILLQPLSKLVILEDVFKLEQVVASVIANRQAQPVDVMASHKEGKTFEVVMMLSPVIENKDQIVGLVLSIHDVTNRNHMLRQAMDLSELKSRYVSMAAHDLRNPMAVILTSSDTLHHYYDRLTEDKKQAKFDQIKSSIKNMTDILDDVLVMGQVDLGKLDFRPTPLDLMTFCQTLAAEAIQATGTTIRVDFSAEGDMEAPALDAKLLRHILSNLLSNAIKYSPADSAVIFRLKALSDHIVFRIQDEGIGIPKTDQVHLFETFYRASNAKQIHGTGLGLAIVKQSVELHGGTITFESEEGHGTTFLVDLPITAQ